MHINPIRQVGIKHTNINKRKPNNGEPIFFSLDGLQFPLGCVVYRVLRY